MSFNSKAKPTNIGRRNFLRGVALGAAAAPLAALVRRWPGEARANASEPLSANLCYSNKRVLTANDMTWLGVFKVPLEMCNQGTDPQGTLAGRYKDGALRFFMQGSERDGSPIVEFGFPGLAGTVASAPRASMLAMWPGIYSGRKTDISGNPLNNAQDTQIFWDDKTQALYWLFIDQYNVTAVNNPVVGCTTFDEVAGTFHSHGPWQIGLLPHQTHRVMLRVPDEFAASYLNGQSLALGCIGTASGNISSSWGPVLAGLKSQIGPGVPAFPATPQVGVTKLVGYDYDHRARRTNDYVVHAAPDVDGGFWTQMDGSSGTGCWIGTPACSGMVFFQMRATGHVWYGVSENCGHGLADSGNPGTTGPHCTSSRLVGYIYDPMDFVGVIAGNRKSYEIAAASEVDLMSKGLWPAHYQRTNGCWFDSSTGRLYVSCMRMDQAGTPVYPIVNVFQIAM